MIASVWRLSGWIAAWRDTPIGVWLLLAVLIVGYSIGLVKLWRHAGAGRGISISRAAAYCTGWLILLITLASPLDTLADGLFSIHMVQHLSLIAVVPPLLVAGEPWTAFAWTARGARWLRRRRMLRATRVGARAIAAGWFAFLLHTAVVWTWHLPALFAAALAHPFWHGVEHASFLATALLLWWVAMRPAGNRRAGYGFGVLLMLGTAMQSGALGALLASSRRVWYSADPHLLAVAHLTALGDQQLAGLIMWVPGGMIYVIAGCALFLGWIRGVAPRDLIQPASAVSAAPATR